MGTLFLGFLVLLVCLLAFFRPWVGVIAYYCLSILGPQYIWWWTFGDVRVSLYVALATIAGVAHHLLAHRYDFDFLKNRQNVYLAVLWMFVVISYFVSPYSKSMSMGGLSPAQLFSITNIIFVFYFVSALELNEIFKIRYLFWVIVVSTLILIVWANAQYFQHHWWQFNMGRLMGPFNPLNDGAIYKDSNTFAMLFVSGLPIVYFMGWGVENRMLRWALWAFIPFGWHAIFLTGSRGGLVGIAVTMLFIILLSQRKMLAIPLLLLFYVFYQWQAGDVMHARSEYIVHIEGEDSAGDRLTAWEGGGRMILSHPLTGVGLGAFVAAVPDYIEIRHMVAHNTIIQFSAESGVGAGLAFSAVLILFFLHSRKIRKWCAASEAREGEQKEIRLYNNALIASFAGLTVCSMFLSLNTYEVIFVLLLLNNALYQYSLKTYSPEAVPEPSTSQVKP